MNCMATTYVAFLRGINVGGRSQIKMGALKEAFESLGFSDVRTILASGNVLFAPQKDQPPALARKIKGKLQEILGSEVSVILRSADDIRAIVKADPFKEVEVTPQTRLYVSFLGEEPEGRIEPPIESPEGDMKIPGDFERDRFFNRGALKGARHNRADEDGRGHVRTRHHHAKLEYHSQDRRKALEDPRASGEETAECPAGKRGSVP